MVKTGLTKSMLLFWPLAITSCAGSWQQNAIVTLNGVYQASKVAHQVSSRLFKEKCSTHAAACAASEPASCVLLAQCQKQREKAFDAIIATQFAVADGLRAIDMSNEKLASEKLKSALKLAEEINQQLKFLGVYQ
jgi:hypothetical protein